MAAHDKYDNDILKALQKIGSNLDKINRSLASKPTEIEPKKLYITSNFKNNPTLKQQYDAITNDMKNTIYLVYGNTYFEEYGAMINFFGAFSTKEEAEYVKKEKEDEYYQKEVNNKYFDTHISRELINFRILEFKLGNITDILLGGYAE